MFRKKNKLQITILDNNQIKINHNLENLPPEQLQKIINSLFTGEIGLWLISDIEIKKPQLKEFIDTLMIKLFPIQKRMPQPVLKPSQVIPNFLNQMRGMMSGE